MPGPRSNVTEPSNTGVGCCVTPLNPPTSVTPDRVQAPDWTSSRVLDARIPVDIFLLAVPEPGPACVPECARAPRRHPNPASNGLGPDALLSGANGWWRSAGLPTVPTLPGEPGVPCWTSAPVSATSRAAVPTKTSKGMGIAPAIRSRICLHLFGLGCREVYVCVGDDNTASRPSPQVWIPAVRIRRPDPVLWYRHYQRTKHRPATLNRLHVRPAIQILAKGIRHEKVRSADRTQNGTARGVQTVPRGGVAGSAGNDPACNIRNYTIFYREGVLFAYFEYHGEDFAADMARWRQTRSPSDGGRS